LGETEPFIPVTLATDPLTATGNGTPAQPGSAETPAALPAGIVFSIERIYPATVFGFYQIIAIGLAKISKFCHNSRDIRRIGAQQYCRTHFKKECLFFRAAILLVRIERCISLPAA
jgi:hypothetical protein